MRTGAALVACVCAASNAATFEVDDLGDAPDALPGDGVCRSEQTRSCTLRAAILEANATVGDDVILLPGGTITLAIPGKHEKAAETGDLDISEFVDIRSRPGTTTTIDGAGLDRVFHVTEGGGARFSDLVIRGGAAEEIGGGVLIRIGVKEVIFERCAITANRAVGGGGIHTGAPTVLRDSSIHENTIVPGVTNTEGAAIRSDRGPLRLERVAVFDNDDFGPVFADAIQVQGTTLDIENSTISGNRQTFDGSGQGMQAISAFLTDATIVNTTIVDHDVGLSVRSGSLKLRNSIVAYNGRDCAWNNLSDDIDGHNLDSDGSCGLADGSGNQSGVDPQLGPLTTGPMTRAHWPLLGSPVIDAGPHSDVPGPDGCADLDQQGVARTMDGDGRQGVSECDLGAVEFDFDPIFADGFSGSNGP